MNTNYDRLIDDHKFCDELLAKLENDVSQSRWDDATSSYASFSAAFNQHIAVEESTFFPMIRKVAGEEAWPVDVLGAEHSRLQMIMLRMASAVSNRQKSDFMLHLESFLILMHTHSIKEEQILYPTIGRLAALSPTGTDFCRVHQ